MSKLKWKGGALLAPVPAVLVSCAHEGRSNLLTVGWTGILCTKPPKMYISVRPSRASYELIKNSGEFCVNLTPSRLVRAVDLCGVRSGSNCDKFLLAGLTPSPSFEVGCPSVEECPVTLECRVFDRLPMGTHDVFLADIVAVSADEALVDKSGRLDMQKASLLAYSHGEYFELGKKLGSFGFSVKKKRSGK